MGILSEESNKYGTFDYGIIKIFNDYPVRAVHVSVFFFPETQCGQGRTGGEIQEPGCLHVHVSPECLRCPLCLYTEY